MVATFLWLNNQMAKQSSSSKRWLQEHFKDEFVKRAKHEGYRARSVYKLMEIQERYKIIKPKMVVVDLGAAPGGWSEFVAQKLQKTGRLLALDILPMHPIAGVEFMQGDFTQESVVQGFLALVGNDTVELVLSDMAPNLSGISEIDQARAQALASAALAFANRVLKTGGTLLVKVFQGAGFDVILGKLRYNFKDVKIIKPDASRSRSKEVFILARGFVKANQQN